MSTTAERLAYLMGTKSGIRGKIIEKDVDVPESTTFREYEGKISIIRSYEEGYQAHENLVRQQMEASY